MPTPVPGTRARGKGILNTWLPASKGDNGEWRQVALRAQHMRPTLLLTTVGRGEWVMENGERGTPIAPRARDALETSI
jgi:hypothetical protein